MQKGGEVVMSKQAGAKGQGVIEYAILLTIVAVALAMMTRYMQGGLNARMKAVSDLKPTDLAGVKDQYFPYYAERNIGTAQAARSRGVIDETGSAMASAEKSVSTGSSTEGVDMTADSNWE